MIDNKMNARSMLSKFLWPDIEDDLENKPVRIPTKPDLLEDEPVLDPPDDEPPRNFIPRAAFGWSRDQND